MKIVVLAGGTSTERDVSIISGSMIAQALKKNGHKVILLDVYLGYEGDVADAFSRADEIGIRANGISEQAPDIEAIKSLRTHPEEFFGPNVIEICRQCDIVFMGLHGANGEDGRVQAALDLYGIKYTGTGYLGSANAMDKAMARQLLGGYGVPIAKGLTMTRAQMDATEPSFGFPCVVKPCCGGSSVGVSIAKNAQEYEEALQTAFSFEDRVVVEAFVSGREFSVGVLDGKALPIIEIAPVEGWYDYKNKYQAGSAVETCPAALSEEKTKEMQHYAEMAAECLRLEAYSRTDFLMNEAGEIFCLESNTLPGMTPTSLLPQEAQQVGISYEELCEKLIALSLKKYQ